MDIGRASKASDVPVKMIRHYEAIGLLPKVARTFANYGVYTSNDVHLLRLIRRARALGFSMGNIKELLSLWQNKSRSSASVKKMAGEHIQDLNVKIAELKIHGEYARAPRKALPWRPPAELPDPGRPLKRSWSQ